VGLAEHLGAHHETVAAIAVPSIDLRALQRLFSPAVPRLPRGICEGHGPVIGVQHVRVTAGVIHRIRFADRIAGSSKLCCGRVGVGTSIGIAAFGVGGARPFGVVRSDVVADVFPPRCTGSALIKRSACMFSSHSDRASVVCTGVSGLRFCVHIRARQRGARDLLG
jgi:hypothetical protein